MIALPLLLAQVSAHAGTLRYAEDQAPGIINPLFTTTMSEARLSELVFEGLYTDDTELRCVPLLAERDVLDEDELAMTIFLRQDVTWHDGRPFSAHDVVFTIEAMKDPETMSTEAGRVSFIESARAVDTHTVQLVFTQPQLSPQEKLTFKILPKHRFISTAIERSHPFRKDPVGTGPYELVRAEEEGSLLLSAYDRYRYPAGISDLTLREISDKNYQAKLLLYESIQALVRVLPRDLAVLDSNRKIELYPYQTNSWWYLGFNLTRAPWDDPIVREALHHMVDVDALLAPVGSGETLTGPYVRSSPYYNHEVLPWAHDTALAAEQLAAAGWQQTGGRWTVDGEPVTLHITAHRGLESSQEVAINLQSQLSSQGVNVELDFIDEVTWRSRIWGDRDFDAILSQWSFDRSEDVREQFHSTGGRNFTGYASEAADALLDAARDSTDPQSKKTALRDLHKVIHDDAPMVFLWTLDSYSAMSTEVEGVVIHPFTFFTWVTDWQMP